jgi:glycosyltransferase involved in cell wall biosynthesis
MNSENVIVSDVSKMNVLLFGPVLNGNVKGSGGGKGGYISYINLVLEYFRESDIQFVYCAYSVRSLTAFWWLFLPFRFIVDLKRFSSLLPRVSIVHIIASSGPAIVRNAIAVFIAKFFKKAVVLDIRGGGPRTYPNHTMPVIQYKLLDYMIRSSDIVLIQSKKIADELYLQYGTQIQYQPNFMLLNEISPCPKQKLHRPEIFIVFVGYCYRDKGVFDIIDGCVCASLKGIKIRLLFIGKEHTEFTQYLDGVILPENLRITRMGVQERSVVLRYLSECDLLLFPTYHRSEGHPNAVNEAMSQALTIITTKKGYITDVLDESTAYFVDPESPKQICDTLIYINNHRDEANQKGLAGWNHVKSHYTDQIVLDKLYKMYQNLVNS